MNDITKYIQDIFGLTGAIKEIPETLRKKLPLYLSHAYNFRLLEIYKKSFLIAEVGNPSPITAAQLKKQAKVMFQITDMPVVYILQNLSAQMRRKMISERICFIVPENQIYLPDLFIYLNERNIRVSSHSGDLTPSAQLLLLYHLQVNNLEEYSFKEIAEKLNYSPKTITKIASELKAKNLCKISGTKEKRFMFDGGREQLWKMSEPQMRAPIIKSFFIDSANHRDFCKSGEMALAHYTFLSDDGKRSYAIYKTEFEELKSKDYWNYLDEIEGDERIEVWKYDPKLLSTNGYIDVLSLYLCYREASNERVEVEIRELIDKKIW